jgi:NTE family protein
MNRLNITHLVLSGGGMYGIITIGALRYLYLENIHRNITHISGTSIGSFIGLMVAFKLNIEEIEMLMYKCLNNQHISKIPRKNYYKLITELGLCSTIHLIEDMKEVLKQKYEDIEDVTFRDLSKRFGVNIYISVTNINNACNCIFSIETTPDVSVFKACEASMTIPLLYKPVLIGDYYYYDGGLTNNFPVKVFKNVPKENVIGIILNKVRDNECKSGVKEKLNLFFICKKIWNIMNENRVKVVLLGQINEKDIDYYYIENNIRLESPINIKMDKQGLQFDINDESINDMIYLGFNGMYKHIENRIRIAEEMDKKNNI